jgi:hypothetical protein
MAKEQQVSPEMSNPMEAIMEDYGRSMGVVRNVMTLRISENAVLVRQDAAIRYFGA